MYFEIKKDVRGNWIWHLKAANHEIIAQGEAYLYREGAEHAVNLVKASFAAPVRYV